MTTDNREQTVDRIREIQDEIAELVREFSTLVKPYKDEVGYSSEVVRTNIYSMLGTEGYYNHMGNMDEIADQIDNHGTDDDDSDDNSDDDDELITETTTEVEPVAAVASDVMIVTALDGAKLSIPTENLEAIRSILVDKIAATFWADKDGIVKLAAHSEYFAGKGWQMTNFIWTRIATGEQHYIVMEAFDKVTAQSK